jgi:hypothetical protein
MNVNVSLHRANVGSVANVAEIPLSPGSGSKWVAYMSGRTYAVSCSNSNLGVEGGFAWSEPTWIVLEIIFSRALTRTILFGLEDGSSTYFRNIWNIAHIYTV